ncbi:MAG: DUF2225 domain-containing protein [Lachnospiraceae bacterium]|nr:DUF2225 domain-containing protein [Lachnospiraceae bacterium]
MNLLSGLEKFGLNVKGDLDITDDGKKKSANKAAGKASAAPTKVEEKDLVLEKSVQCPVCDHKFKTLTAKSGKAKRLEPDSDLRPNFEGIDTLKYEVCSCPNCGYSAMNKFFEHLSMSQIKWIREAVGENFSPVDEKTEETYSYQKAVDHYKLALVCAMAKHGKLSEKAVVCLRIAWLRRGELKTIGDKTPEEIEKRKELTEEMEGFYRQAYDGLKKAFSTETPPYCGMNSNTVEYLLANMAYHFKEYGEASKLVTGLLANPNTPSRVKDLCRDLKEQIVKEVKIAKAKAARAAAAKAASPNGKPGAK